MAQYTKNYKLKKPESSDYVDVQDLNDNFDTIDTTIKQVNDKIPILASNTGASTTQGMTQNAITTAVNAASATVGRVNADNYSGRLNVLLAYQPLPVKDNAIGFTGYAEDFGYDPETKELNVPGAIYSGDQRIGGILPYPKIENIGMSAAYTRVHAQQVGGMIVGYVEWGPKNALQSNSAKLSPVTLSFPTTGFSSDLYRHADLPTSDMEAVLVGRAVVRVFSTNPRVTTGARPDSTAVVDVLAYKKSDSQEVVCYINAEVPATRYFTLQMNMMIPAV